MCVEIFYGNARVVGQDPLGRWTSHQNTFDLTHSCRFGCLAPQLSCPRNITMNKGHCFRRRRLQYLCPRPTTKPPPPSIRWGRQDRREGFIVCRTEMNTLSEMEEAQRGKNQKNQQRWGMRGMSSYISPIKIGRDTYE